MNSALGAVVGLILAIVLIIRKFSPVYSLMIGAITGGLLGGLSLESTVSCMISGVKDITPECRDDLVASLVKSLTLKTRNVLERPLEHAAEPCIDVTEC